MTEIALKLDADEYATMAKSAQQACDLLRGLAHEARLIILCMLSEGEKSVGELEAFPELRQPTVSQQLARLRADRLGWQGAKVKQFIIPWPAMRRARSLVCFTICIVKTPLFVTSDQVRWMPCLHPPC